MPQVPKTHVREALLNAARAELAKIPATWIDAGNHFSSGQVVIGNTSDAANIKRALEEATRRKSDTLMLCPNAALVFPELLQPETQPQPAVSCADLVALGDQQAGVHLVEEHGAVGQPGEGVVGGEVVDALLRGFAFRDIGDGQDDAP